jgi:hypothetical protein
MGLLLTDQERDRFASWLEREAKTAKGMIEELEKIYPSSHPMIAIEKKKRGRSTHYCAEITQHTQRNNRMKEHL